MSTQSYYALQKAVYALLKNDAVLSALIEGVFDHVPQETPYPYIVFSQGQVETKRSSQESWHEHQLRLRIYSRKKGRKELSEIMARVETLLSVPDMEPEGQQLVLFHGTTSQIQLGNDGVTYEAVMRFQAITFPTA